jgi:hypothetical protein
MRPIFAPRSSRRLGAACAAALALAWAAPASGLTIAIDLDTALPGIQTTRAASLGETFAVDVVLIGDGVTAFDEVILDVGYNDAAPVLASGPGSVVALALSATVATAWDVTVPTVAPPLPAPPAALASLGFAPVAPYTASEGGFGYYTFPGDFPVVGAGVGVTVAGFLLTAVGVGTSTVEPTPTTGAALYLGSMPVPATFASGTVTVPEPATGALLLLGLVALGARSRRRSLC